MSFDFAVVRLGKDSVDDIEKIDAIKQNLSKPFTLEFTCSQVEKTIHADTYALIYLGSDNNKGIPTRWKQGIRALGKIIKKDGGEEFNSECTLSIEVFSVLSESLDQISFLDKSPSLYKHFAKYPVIGVRTSRNNAVQKVNNGPRESTHALLTSINLIYPPFSHDLQRFAPELLTLLNFKADADPNGVINEANNSHQPNCIEKASNTIFYGAPGTGKSYAIDSSIVSARAFKTVFHAESMNSDFVGGIKPVLHSTDNNKRAVTYEYVPGPLLKAIISALNDPNNSYWLIIEEINRAPAAAVFGEFFQLLDRDSSGRSSYDIDFPDSICEEFVNSKLNVPISGIFLPANLSNIASMNSGDQGVLPLDTAFKRRWRFRYMPIDFSKDCITGNLSMPLDGNEHSIVSWQHFAQSINFLLSELGIPEDRHLGPFFLSEDDFSDQENCLAGKLFMYLWDDVLRHGLRHRLFSSDIRTYGELVRRTQSGGQIFNSDFAKILLPSLA